LKHVPSYVDITLEEIVKLAAELRTRQTHKRLTCQNVLAIIQFSQELMQQGWINKDPFMQLPNFTPEDCAKLREALPKGTTIYKYAIMDELQRKALLSNLFNWTPE
jgi:hypothetical protein